MKYVVRVTNAANLANIFYKTAFERTRILLKDRSSPNTLANTSFDTAWVYVRVLFAKSHYRGKKTNKKKIPNQIQKKTENAQDYYIIAIEIAKRHIQCVSLYLY